MFKSILVTSTLVFAFVCTAAAQGYVWTYQGKLNVSGSPANGSYDIRIAQLEAIDQEGVEGTVFEDVNVVNGIFAVNITTGTLFLIENRLRFIEIAIRPGASTGAFTVLSPRQAVNMVPYAGRSATASESNYAVNATNVSGGTISGNGSGITNINGANIAIGTITTEQIANNSLSREQRLRQLGMLRWDRLGVPKNFTLGGVLNGIAFDGKHIWVTSFTDNTVTKLTTPDGTVVGTYPTGTGPRGLAFDGTSIWVANSTGNSLTKLNADDGSSLGTFPLAGQPRYLAFDGENIWVTLFTGNQVAKVKASDGVVIGTYAVGTNPSSIAYDGRIIWVANTGSLSYTRINGSDGSDFGTTGMPSGRIPACIAFDGTNIWIAGAAIGGIVRKIKAESNTVLNDFPHQGGQSGCAFDGTSIWIKDSGNIGRYRTSDFDKTYSNFVGSNSSLPGPNIVFDGAFIWSANTDGTVSRVPALPEP